MGWQRLALLLLMAVGGLVVWRWAGGRGDWSRRRLGLLLLWVVVWTPLTQLAVAAQHRVQPLAIAFSAPAGAFTEGVQIDNPRDFAREHVNRMSGYRDVHLRTQPPGWPLAFWAAAHLWTKWPQGADVVGRWLFRIDCLSTDLLGLSPAQLAGGTVSIGILLLSGLGALPLYGIGRRLAGARPSRLALVLYPFWPGLLVFQGRFDVLYALLALLAVWLALVVWEDGRWWAAAALGLLLALGTGFGFGVLAVALLLNCLLLALLLLRRPTWRAGLRRMALINGWLAGGLLLFWGALWLLWQINGLEMFWLSQSIHRTLRINYPLWPLFNLFDVAVFMGIVVFGGALLALAAAAARRRTWQPVDVLVAGWVLALLALNFSGQVRAETGRLWLLLMGPGLLVGVAGWEQWLHERRGWETAVFAAFVVQALITGVFLGGRAPQPNAPQPQWRLPVTAEKLAYRFGDTIALRGYELFFDDDDVMRLVLYWQALDFPRDDFAVFAHLLSADGGMVAQNDGAPLQGHLPTWCWVPGEVVADERELPWAGPGESVGVGLYHWRTGERLPVTPAVADEMVRLPTLNAPKPDASKSDDE